MAVDDQHITTGLAALRADPDFLALAARLDRFDPFAAPGAAADGAQHTAVLAWLLDPRRNHGLGDAFLRHFLHRFADGAGAGLSATTAAGPQERKAGAPDVLVEGADWAVAIVAGGGGKDDLHRLKPLRERLLRRFAARPPARLRLLYLTVRDEPEVLAENPGWSAIQWGREVVAALDAALAQGGGADPALHAYLQGYRAALQRLADALDGTEDAVQALANRHHGVLLALKGGLARCAAEGAPVLPWTSAPAWAAAYRERREAFDALLARTRSAEAQFADAVLRRLVAARPGSAAAGGVLLLGGEQQGRGLALRFVPRAWADWRIDTRERALPLHGLMFYRLALRPAQQDVELKLVLPDVAEHALQAGLVRLLLGPDNKRPDLCLEPDPDHLGRFLAGQAGTLKLYRLLLRWHRDADTDALGLDDGEDGKFAEFWRAVAAHADALAYLVRKGA